MHSGMTIGPPILRVRDLERVLEFYQEGLGLQLNRRYQNADGNLACELGFKQQFTDGPLLILDHDPTAKRASRRSAGLYHFAILLPDRKSLASTYLALGNSGVYYEGFADHLVSESLYLRDPEDNGIEIYVDRPAAEWRRDPEGQIMMDTLPLDLDSLLTEISKEDRKNATSFPLGARIGHIHLRVTNLQRSIRFYHENLGLDMTLNWSSMGAAFLSVGGYHHHVGVNTWHSLDGETHAKGVAGLENSTIIIPDKSFVKALASQVDDSSPTHASENQLLVSDPDGIQFLFKFK